MAVGDITPRWGSWTTLTQTALDGLAASSTHVAGWESDAITATGYEDVAVHATIVVESAGLTAGEIKLWIVPKHNATAWPDVFDGTQSAETVVDVPTRDAVCRVGAVARTDTTASQTYYLHCESVKAVCAGNMPETFVVFITQNTGAALETTGDLNQVYWRGSYSNVANA